MELHREHWEAWMEGQSIDRRFEWISPHHCAVNCFIQEVIGREAFSGVGRSHIKRPAKKLNWWQSIWE